VPGTRLAAPRRLLQLPGAKLRPPPHLVPLVGRDRLLSRLGTAAGVRLVLVQAPAGYGKTTLLGQWQERLASAGVQVAWVALEPRDRQIDRFLACLAAALGRPDLAPPVPIPEPELTEAVDALLQALDGRQRPLVLILDDYDRVATPANDGLVERLCRQGPGGLRVALAVRRRPLLPLAELRARGVLIEIDGRALCLDETEALGLLPPGAGLGRARELVARTGGWPVAVQLLAGAHAGPHAGAHVDDRDAAERPVDEFLASEVLAELGPELRAFLVETAVLDRLAVEPADAVRGRADGASMLHRAETLLPLVEPDGAGGWRRNPMLTACLRRELARAGTTRVRALHAAAASWLAARGEIDAAVHHAREAKDARLAASIIESAGGMALFVTRGQAALRGLIESLPPELVHATPRLRVARALLLAKAGRPREARLLLDEARLGSSGAVGRDGPLGRELLLVDRIVAAYEDAEGAGDELRELERRALAAPPTDPWYQGCLHNALCIRHIREGALSAARAAAHRALAHYRDAGAMYGQVMLHVHQGIIAWAEARIGTALDRLDEGARLARAHFPDDAGLLAIPELLQASLYYERNRLDLAWARVARALPQVERHEGWVEIFLHGYTVEARLAYDADGLAAALARLDRALETADRWDLPRLRRLLAWRRAELWTRAGELDRARALTDRLGGDGAGRRSSWRERAVAAVTLGRLLVHRGEADAALAVLRPATAAAVEQGGRAALLRLRAIEAMALAELGRCEEAVEVLDRLLLVAVPEGLTRLLIDEGPRMGALLRLAAGRHEAARAGPAAAAFVGQVIRALEAPACADPTSCPLSRRERQIVHELSLGHSNKAIARTLELTEATVKFHLRNIYAKLGVRNRVNAIAAARRHALVP
jgi:LuxR family transcriptional regulator, maltose regulon positive regulatory protein